MRGKLIAWSGLYKGPSPREEQGPDDGDDGEREPLNRVGQVGSVIALGRGHDAQLRAGRRLGATECGPAGDAVRETTDPHSAMEMP